MPTLSPHCHAGRYCARASPLLFLMEHQRSRIGVTQFVKVCSSSSDRLKGGVLSSLQVSRILSGNGLFAQRSNAMSVLCVTTRRQEMIATQISGDGGRTWVKEGAVKKSHFIQERLVR